MINMYCGVQSFFQRTLQVWNVNFKSFNGKTDTKAPHTLVDVCLSLISIPPHPQSIQDSWRISMDIQHTTPTLRLTHSLYHFVRNITPSHPLYTPLYTPLYIGVFEGVVSAILSDNVDLASSEDLYGGPAFYIESSGGDVGIGCASGKPGVGVSGRPC